MLKMSRYCTMKTSLSVEMSPVTFSLIPMLPLHTIIVAINHLLSKLNMIL